MNKSIHLNTFSLTARCKETGKLGVGVLTKAFGVGFLCPFVMAEVGAISMGGSHQVRKGSFCDSEIESH
jgi:uncharacterized Ntn-hydrolase superfamily protein